MLEAWRFRRDGRKAVGWTSPGRSPDNRTPWDPKRRPTASPSRGCAPWPSPWTTRISGITANFPGVEPGEPDRPLRVQPAPTADRRRATEPRRDEGVAGCRAARGPFRAPAEGCGSPLLLGAAGAGRLGAGNRGEKQRAPPAGGWRSARY